MLNVLLLNSLTPILSFLARDVGVNANIVVCRGRVPGLETAARIAVPVVPRSPSLQHTLLGQSRQGEDGVLLQCSIIRIVNTNYIQISMQIFTYAVNCITFALNFTLLACFIFPTEPIENKYLSFSIQENILKRQHKNIIRRRFMFVMTAELIVCAGLRQHIKLQTGIQERYQYYRRS